MITGSRNHGQLTLGSGWSAHTFPPRFRNLGSRAKNKAGHWKEHMSGPPRLGPFFPGTQCSATPQSKRHGRNEVRKIKNRDRVIAEGKERKLNHATVEATAEGKTMGQHAGEARFPLSTSTARGKGGKPFPSSVAGLGTLLSSPAGLPQINIRAEGTDLLLSKISKLCTRV